MTRCAQTDEIAISGINRGEGLQNQFQLSCRFDEAAYVVVRTYSKKLLLPYVGVIQVAEIDGGRARALSLDGENWAIRYALNKQEKMRNTRGGDDHKLNYSLVATIEQGRLETKAVHPFLDLDAVRAATKQLFEVVISESVPFPALDLYEYWLLDDRDDSPLALLHSSVDAEGMDQPPPRPMWRAMAAAELEVHDPEPPDQAAYVPPVNYRLQKLIEERAGNKPRAAWFERPDPADDGFPPCLIREDWENGEHQRICALYIQRLAPRLLMMQGLSRPQRHRLEQSARDFVFDVERFYPLYPEVVDTGLMNAARVEARIRRAATH